MKIQKRRKSKRREKARDHAEETCRALREWITMMNCDRKPEDFQTMVYPYFSKWMRNSGNICYLPPEIKEPK